MKREENNVKKQRNKRSQNLLFLPTKKSERKLKLKGMRKKLEIIER